MSLLNQSIIKHEMGLLLAEELQNASQACRVMGVSRDTFYRVKEARESGGIEAMELFDPVSGTFTPNGTMHDPRIDDTTALLQNGKTLLAGGAGDSSAELYS